jgi:hypothetical protein
MSLKLSTIFSKLSEHPDLFRGLMFEHAVKFVDLAYLLKPYLGLSQSHYVEGPPKTLPRYLHNFLKSSLELDGNSVKLLWNIFGDTIWDCEWSNASQEELAAKYIPYFLKYGYRDNIGECWIPVLPLLLLELTTCISLLLSVTTTTHLSRPRLYPKAERINTCS